MMQKKKLEYVYLAESRLLKGCFLQRLIKFKKNRFFFEKLLQNLKNVVYLHPQLRHT